MKKSLISLLSIFFLFTAIANASPRMNTGQEVMSVQVIKEQLHFSKKSFKSIKMLKLDDNRYAVQIELNPQAAKELQELTAENINKSTNIVWHGRIINSATIRAPLGAKFQITGFNKQQAEAFINALT